MRQVRRGGAGAESVTRKPKHDVVRERKHEMSESEEALFPQIQQSNKTVSKSQFQVVICMK